MSVSRLDDEEQRGRHQGHAPSGINSHGECDRKRGSLGPLAIAPFPIPAHQTGRADFQHPVFRLASPRGTRRGSSVQGVGGTERRVLDELHRM